MHLPGTESSECAASLLYKLHGGTSVVESGRFALLHGDAVVAEGDEMAVVRAIVRRTAAPEDAVQVVDWLDQFSAGSEEARLEALERRLTLRTYVCGHSLSAGGPSSTRGRACEWC